MALNAVTKRSPCIVSKLDSWEVFMQRPHIEVQNDTELIEALQCALALAIQIKSELTVYLLQMALLNETERRLN